ncbi:MAG: hypothetical protein ACLU9X_03360 [Alistipes shahii]
MHYNQVAGKADDRLVLRQPDLPQRRATATRQTIYYMQDGEPPEITMMGVIESGDCSFYIEDKQVVQIVYRNGAVWRTSIRWTRFPPDAGALPEGLQVGGRAASDAGRRSSTAGAPLAARRAFAAAASGFPAS